jgi:hypothetical protein
MTILSIDSYSLVTVIGVAIIAFGLGLLIKSAIIFKQRRRILRLEDEMLANHAKILSLEKVMNEARKAGHNYELSSGLNSDRDLKAI